MKTENIKQLVNEAMKGLHLIPVRAYFIEEAEGHLKVKMPLVAGGKKHHTHASLPSGLVYYTFNDKKGKETAVEEQALFMLVPLNLWKMMFGDNQPGWTWTAPQKFNIASTFHGDSH